MVRFSRGIGKMSLYKYAKSELDLIYSKESLKSDINKSMYDCILKLIGTFAKQGHSGASANYCLETFFVLAQFKPLKELTSNPKEWMEVGTNIYQSKRNPSCFSTNLNYYYDLDKKYIPKWKRLFIKNIKGMKLIKLK